MGLFRDIKNGITVNRDGSSGILWFLKPWYESIQDERKKRLEEEEKNAPMQTPMTEQPVQSIPPVKRDISQMNFWWAIPQSQSIETTMKNFNEKQANKPALSSEQTNLVKEKIAKWQLGMQEAVALDSQYWTKFSTDVWNNRLWNYVKDISSPFGKGWDLFKSTLNLAAAPFWAAIWVAKSLVSNDEEKKAAAENIISGIEGNKEVEIELTEAQKREEERIEAYNKAEEDMIKANEIIEAAKITNNPSIYPEEAATNAIQLLKKNKILSYEQAVNFFNTTISQAQKVQDDVVLDQARDSAGLIWVFWNKEAAAKYAEDNILPFLVLSDEEKGTREWQLKFALKNRFLNTAILKKLPEDVRNLSNINWVSPAILMGDSNVTSTIQWTFSAIDKMLETNGAEKYITADWNIDFAGFARDLSETQEIKDIDKRYNINLQDNKYHSAINRGKSDETSRYAAPSLYLDATWARLAKWSGWWKNISEWLKDEYQGVFQSTVRNMVIDPFIREAWWYDAALVAGTAITMFYWPSALLGLIRAWRVWWAIEAYLNTPSLITSANVVRKWTNLWLNIWAEVVSSMPFDFVMNKFLPPEETNWYVDFWFNAAWWLFGKRLAAVDEIYAYVKKGIDTWMGREKLAEDILQMYGVNIPVSRLESPELTKTYLGEMLSSVSGGMQMQAVAVAEWIKKAAMEADDAKLLTLKSQISSVNNSSLFWDAQKAVNKEVFSKITDASTPEEIRAAFMEFWELYNVKQYEKLMEVRYKEAAGRNIIDWAADRINQAMKDWWMNVPADFWFKIALATYLNPAFMKDSKNMSKFLVDNFWWDAAAAIKAAWSNIIVDWVKLVADAKMDIESPDFVKKIIDKAKKAVDEYNIQKAQAINGNTAATRQSIADTTIDKIQKDVWAKITKEVNAVKSPIGKLGVLKNEIMKWLQSNGIPASDAIEYADWLATSYMIKHINKKKWYSIDDLWFLDNMQNADEMFAKLYDVSVDDGEKALTLESFLSDVVKKLYGKWVAGEAILKWMRWFLDKYNANKSLLINSWVDEAFKGFLVELPNEWAKQFVIWLGWEMLEQVSKILQKGTITKADKAVLSKTLGVVMHEVWHIAVNAMSSAMRAGIQEVFKSKLFQKWALDVDTLSKLLSENDIARYQELMDSGKSMEYIVDEFLADYLSQNLSTYIFDSKAFEVSAKSLFDSLGKKKATEMFSALEDINSMLSTAGEFVKWVIAMAYLTNPKTKTFGKFLNELKNSDALGNVDFMDITKDPSVFFKKAEEVVKNAQLEDFYSQDLSENIWEGFFRALLTGQWGITKLNTTISTISKALKKGSAKWIILDTAYLTPQWQFMLYKYFNNQNISEKNLEIFNKILTQSKEFQLEISYWMRNRIFNNLFNLKNETISLKNWLDNMSNISISTAKTLSDWWVNSKKWFVWGIIFAPILTLTKYIWLRDPKKFWDFFSKVINRLFEDGVQWVNIKEALGENVWALWMDLYSKVWDKLVKMWVDADTVADITHPLIYSAEEYISALAKSWLKPEEMVDSLIWLLKKTTGNEVFDVVDWLKAFESSSREKVYEHMYKGMDVWAKNMSITKLEDATIRMIDELDEASLTFGIATDRMNEYLYKMYDKNFWALSGKMTIIDNLIWDIFSVVKRDEVSPDVVMEIKNIMYNLKNASVATSKWLKLETDVMWLGIDKLKELIEKLPYKSDVDKALVKDMVSWITKETLSQRNFFDIARELLYKNIKNTTNYNAKKLADIENMVDEKVLEAAANKDAILKERAIADKRIVKERVEAELSWLWDEAFAEEKAKMVSVLERVWAADVVPEKEYNWVVRAISDMLKKGRNPRGILKNEDVLAIFNDTVIDAYGANWAEWAYYFNFYKDSYNRVWTKTKYVPPVGSGWSRFEKYLSRSSMARQLMDSDPESANIMHHVDRNKKIIKFKNISSFGGANTMSATEFFSKLGDRIRTLAIGDSAWEKMVNPKLSSDSITKVWNSVLSGDDVYGNLYKSTSSKWKQKSSYVLNKEEWDLAVVLSRALRDILEYRKLWNLWPLPIDLLRSSKVTSVSEMINRISAPWNYMSYDDVQSLIAKYWTDSGKAVETYIPQFVHNTLLSWIKDVKGVWFLGKNLFVANTNVTQWLRRLVFTWRYNPLNISRLVWDVTTNLLDAESTFKAVAYLDSDLYNRIAKVVEADVDFHLKESGKMWEISMEWASWLWMAWDNLFSKINVLLWADKASMKSAMKMAISMWIQDIIEKYGAKWTDAKWFIDDFLSNIEKFSTFKAESGIEEYYFLTKWTPAGKIVDYADKKWISVWEAYKEFAEQSKFFNDEYSPFVAQSKTALTTFYAFDNIAEFGVVSKIARYPSMFWLMKRAVTKSTEMGSLFYKEIKQKGLNWFMKSILTWDSFAMNKYWAMAAMAAKTAHTQDRVTWWEQETWKVTLSYMAPIIAIQMWLIYAVGNATLKSYNIQKEYGEWFFPNLIKELMYYVGNRAFVYHQGISSMITTSIGTAANTEWDTFTNVLQSLLYTWAWRMAVTPFMQRVAWIDYLIPDLNGDSFIKNVLLWTQYSSQQAESLREASAQAWLINSAWSPFFWLNTDSVMYTIPIIGDILSAFSWWWAQRNRQAKLLKNYMEEKNFSSLFNWYANPDVVWWLMQEYDSNYLKDKYKEANLPGDVDNMSKEELILKLIKSGNLTIWNASPSVESFMEGMLLASWAGEQMKDMQVWILTDEKKWAYLELFNLIWTISKWNAAWRPSDSDMETYLAAATRLWTSYTTAQMIDAMFTYMWNSSEKQYISADSKVKNKVKYLASWEKSEVSEYAKDANLSDKAAADYATLTEDNWAWQEEVIKSIYPYIAREDVAPANFVKDFLDKATDSPVSLNAKMENPTWRLAQYWLLKIFDMAVDSNWQPNQIMTAQNAIALNVFWNVSQMSKKDWETDEAYASRVESSYTSIQNLVDSVNFWEGSDAAKAQAKSHIALMAFPFVKALTDADPKVLHKVATIIWEGDQEKWLALIESALWQLHDSKEVDPETAFQLTTGIDLDKWGKWGGAKHSPKAAKEFAIAAIKANKAIAGALWKLETIRFTNLPTGKNANRKRARIRPTEVVKLPEREKFAREYRNIGQPTEQLKPVRTPDLAVKSSRVLWWKVRVSNIRNAKVYSKSIGI